MSIAALLLAFQAASPAPERFDILAPVPSAPCRTRPTPEEIVVCANAEPTQRMPLPEERGPSDRPVPVNPYMRGTVAMAAQAAPCATVQGGCQTGVDIVGAGVAAVRLVGKLIDPNSCCEQPGQATNPVALVRDMVGGAKRIGAKKPDKSKRVPIPLDDPAPVASRQDVHP